MSYQCHFPFEIIRSTFRFDNQREVGRVEARNTHTPYTRTFAISLFSMRCFLIVIQSDVSEAKYPSY